MFQFCKTHGFTKSPALVFLIIHFRSIFPGVIKPVPPDNGQDSWHDNQGIREQWGGQTSPSGDLIIWRAAIVLLTLEVATPCTGSLWPNSTEYGLVWWRRWAGHWRSGDCSTAVSRRYCSWTGTQVLQYYACLLPLVDISHPHAVLLFHITLFQTVAQWRVFLTKPRPLQPQPGAARSPLCPEQTGNVSWRNLIQLLIIYLLFHRSRYQWLLYCLRAMPPSFLKIYLIETYFTQTRDTSQIKGRKKIEAIVYVFQSVYW